MFQYRLEEVPPDLTEWISSFERLLVLGFGGSVLPLRIFVESAGLGEKIICWDRLSRPPFFAQKTLYCVVSKSGETLEVKALLRDLLPDLGPDNLLCVTDPERGALREWQTQNSFRSLPIPQEIGGRFTHFSVFHRALLESQGISMSALLDRAKKKRDALMKDSSELEEIADIFFKPQAPPCFALWAYGAAHEAFAAWAQQALAESLGKKDSAGRRYGKLPFLLKGPQDQHSVLQYLVDGPQNQGLWLMAPKPEVEPPWESSSKIPKFLQTLSGQSLSKIEWILAESTYRSFLESNESGDTHSPLLRWSFSRSLEEMTEKIVVIQAFVEAMGQSWGIDAFNQPGVERGKGIARKLL